LTWRSLPLSENFFAKFLAELLFHWLNRAFILFDSSLPCGRLVLVGIKRVDLSEGVESVVYFETITLLWCQKSQKLIMLRTKLENHVDPNYNVLKVIVQEGLALPLMLFILGFPEISS